MKSQQKFLVGLAAGAAAAFAGSRVRSRAARHRLRRAAWWSSPAVRAASAWCSRGGSRPKGRACACSRATSAELERARNELCARPTAT